MIEIVEGPTGIAMGVDRLSAGELVAFPTETVYGLGADALCSDAVEKVFALKGRPSTNPLIVHVAGIEMAKTVVASWPKEAELMAQAFWPGAMTLVLPKADCLPEIVCAGGETVAVRCPEHPCALALIESFGGPIVGPSANPSGRISPTTPEHVIDGFGGGDQEVDLVVIDGGHCRAGIESTVVDLSGDVLRVLRPGIIGAHAISETLGREVQCVTSHATESVVRSPGVVGAHYQPSTNTRLVDSAQLAQADEAVVLVAWSIDTHPAGGRLITIPEQLAAYASSIYRALHEADARRGTEIWVQTPPIAHEPSDQAIRSAIMERLGRATHT